MVGRRFVVGLVLAGAIAAGRAGAQPLPQDPGAIFSVGVEAFEAGNFRRALEAFERVFALRGNPDLLFNIYRCHRAMGDPERAVHALRRYLVARPDVPERATLEAELTSLDAQARALAARPRPAAPRGPASAPRGPGAGPWIVLGAGAIVAGVGVGLMVAAGGSQGDASSAPSELARQERLDGASAQHTAGIALLATGSAAAVAGVLWRVLAPRGPTVDVAVGADRVALTLGARWP